MTDGVQGDAGVTIWHNPSCSNSRGALALLRERGIEPRVVLYLKARAAAHAGLPGA